MKDHPHFPSSNGWDGCFQCEGRIEDHPSVLMHPLDGGELVTVEEAKDYFRRRDGGV